MKIDQCQYDLETQLVSACDPCRRLRFKRRVPFYFGDRVLYVTYVYEVVNCPIGFSGGDLLYALSLLPKEEQEVEIIQRRKYERALHQERSVESHFEREFMSTLRTEVATSLDVNTSVSAEGGFDFLVVSGGANVNVDTAAHFSQNTFAETVNKASASVSSHYEVAVDTKTEIENSYRALRRISNPSACRVVTYFFKQLMKKFHLQVVLVDIKFDIVLQTPPQLHDSVLPYHIEEQRFATAVRKPAIFESQDPHETDQLPAAQTQVAGVSRGKLQLPDVRVSAVNAYRSLVYRSVDMPKELDLQALARKAEAMKLPAGAQKEILGAATKLAEGSENRPGAVLFSTEYCVRTNSVIAEPKVSACSICTCDECECDKAEPDPQKAALAELEIARMKLQIELLQRQLAATA